MSLATSVILTIVQVVSGVMFVLWSISTLVGGLWMLLNGLPGFGMLLDQLKYNGGPHVTIILFILGKLKYMLFPCIFAGLVYLVVSAVNALM